MLSQERDWILTIGPCMTSYEQLAASRKAWIDDVLVAWCREAPRGELLKAEADWANIAGQVDPEATLWTWAWGRFPALVHPEMSGLDETREACVRLADGTEHRGFPDARRSRQGELWLAGPHAGPESEAGPFSIDAIAEVTW